MKSVHIHFKWNNKFLTSYFISSARFRKPKSISDLESLTKIRDKLFLSEISSQIVLRYGFFKKWLTVHMYFVGTQNYES